MSDWKRTTRDIPLEDLSPQLLSAIRQHIEQHDLGPILSEAIMCIQTDSKKARQGLLGAAETVYMGAVITPRWLVWSVSETKAEASALSAQLTHVTVQDYAQTPFAKLVPDSGIQVSGMFTDASESATAFIGLDESAAGKKFREAIFRAAQDAKK